MIVPHLLCLVQAETFPGAMDSDLVERFVVDQDEAAFAALLRRHGPMVLNVCRRVLRQTHDVEDVFQATFWLLARKAGAIRKRASVGGWLHRVAFRLAVQARAKNQRRQRQERQAAAMRTEQPRPENAWREWQAALDEELDRLPLKYRAVLLLCYWEEQTQEEAAHHLGCPVGTVRSRLARGRTLLQKRLVRRGLALSGPMLGTVLVANTAAAALPLALLRRTMQLALRHAAGPPTGLSTQLLWLAERGINPSLVHRSVALLLPVVATLGLCVGAGALVLYPVAGKKVMVRAPGSANDTRSIRESASTPDDRRALLAINEGMKSQRTPREEKLDDPAARDRRHIVEDIEKLRGQVEVDTRSPGDPIVEVNLANTRVTDAWLVHLRGLTSLRRLNLANTPITDAGLTHLKDLSALEVLMLDSTRVADSGLAHLKRLTRLQHIGLKGTRVTDAGLSQLKGRTRLTSLAVGFTTVSDAGLAQLKSLTQLRELHLDSTRVTDRGLAELRNLTQLRDLDLSGTAVTDAGLAQLARLSKLQGLNLAGTKVTDAGIAHLSGLINLQWVSLNHTGVTDTGLVHLRDLPSLQTLYLGDTKVTAQGLAELHRARPKAKVFR